MEKPKGTVSWPKRSFLPQRKITEHSDNPLRLGSPRPLQVGFA